MVWGTHDKQQIAIGHDMCGAGSLESYSAPDERVSQAR